MLLPLEQQFTLVLDLTRAVTEAPDLHSALEGLLPLLTTSTGWCYGEVWRPDERGEYLRSIHTWYADDPGLADFAAASGDLRFSPGVGLVGRAWAERRPVWVSDFAAVEPTAALHPERVLAAGLRSMCILPILAQEHVLGVLVVFGRKVRPLSPTLLRILTLLAAQLGTVIRYLQSQEDLQAREAMLRQANETLERRVAERTADLQAANQELARVARLKDEFLANMSHELRTPLNSILALTETVSDGVYGALNERQRYALGAVFESGQHLLALINDILDLAKIESGKVTLAPEPVDVEAICATSVRMVRQMAHSRRLRLSTTLDPLAEGLVADPRRLKQILVNLLSNAVKFTPEGGSVDLNVAGDREGGVVRFMVIDTGIGIDEADLPQLFKPFVQVDSSHQYEGTGLGLALVAHLAELHGGGVSVRSIPGQGSCFSVSLPWSAAPVPVTPAAAPAPATSRPGAGERPVVLLAEDNTQVLRTTADYLEARGYCVRTAAHGAEAVAMAQASPPDVILMDIQMPVMDGLTAMRTIRADPRLAQVPMIALTALAMVGDHERCLAAGASDYLSKPTSLVQLVERIEALRRSAQDR